ncbi:uroporphyrinogen-III C-methyltransferase [Chloroflexota bacterium]
MMKTGKVYLVGAGPGDPALITVKGMDCLKKADVIIYDRLLGEHLLEVASPAVELIYVGKKAGEHAKPQDEINMLLVAKAREGKRVVRLKGGDPFVLGRGGEEAEVLVQNKIAFEVVPGITSAVAVPAYAGIPVTHRNLASSFAVITGHEDPTKESSSINWEKLATGVDTLVFLMGMKNLNEIIDRLIKHGRSPDTPVAIIKEGTRSEQYTVEGNLKDILTKVTENDIKPPAIIIVGEVVRLREKIRWFDNRPLFGKRVLVTRARHQASALSRLLTERGARPVELPAIDIRPVADLKELDRAILNLKHYHWIIFTSTNGVNAFWQRLHTLELDSRAFSTLKIGAIGPATAQALETSGIVPDYVPEVYTSEGIIAGLENQNVSGQRFLLPRADIADKELLEGICRLGASVHEINAYRTTPATEAITQAKQMIISGKIDVITFTSSSTVSNLMAVFGKEPVTVNGARVACIGPKTAETAIKFGLSVDIMAKEQTILGLVTAIEGYFEKET